MSSLLAVVERSSDDAMVVEDYLAREDSRRRGRRPDRAARGRRSAVGPLARGALTGQRAAADRVLIAAADRDLLGVQVLEQRLGELARGPELVAQLGERDLAPVLVGDRDHPPADVAPARRGGSAASW